jgi:hypothetical protein
MVAREDGQFGQLDKAYCGPGETAEFFAGVGMTATRIALIKKIGRGLFFIRVYPLNPRKSASYLFSLISRAAPAGR